MKSQPIATTRKQARHCRHQREDGTRCRASVQPGKHYCFFHDPALEAERAAARRAGGNARVRKLALPAKLPVSKVRTAADVVSLLSETFYQVRDGEIDPDMANTICDLANIFLAALEQASLEEREAALEAAAAGQSPGTNPPTGDNESLAFRPRQESKLPEDPDASEAKDDQTFPAIYPRKM